MKDNENLGLGLKSRAGRESCGDETSPPLARGVVLAFSVCLLTLISARGQTELQVSKAIEVVGQTKPIPVSMSGFSGEVAQVLEFDLYVQGFTFTSPEAAQYLITGSNNGSVTGQLRDPHNNSTMLSKAYTGASLRRQAHAFSDDIVLKVTGRKGIAQTKIACKVQNGANSEIYIADFDGHNAQMVTRDDTLVVAPCWVPGRLALYYTSYKLNHPDIFYHDLSTGTRRVFARYGGSNMSPAASPDGSQVAMILSKDGWTDLYVCQADGTDLRRLTKSPQDESSPCWSPDGKWICYAAKDKEHRSLCKIPASGGTPQRIATTGTPSPTEPDWSPDNKWIAYTAQYRNFEICVVPAGGGQATLLVDGEDPSWAPNSRTLIYTRRQGGGTVLSLLDAPTKQVKDVSRISGSSNSQPSWAR
ncbi:WD40 domain protein beta Propeller [Verrucomicrobia bacterium]|nr:WD40 domain protein beta Propeller [Verrucomicrobiota bacterium]